MIPYEEALELALRSVEPLGTVCLPLERAAGSILAEDVRSETDLPPFDRAAMDGYAVRSSDLGAGGAELRLVGEVAAGAGPGRAVGPGECARVFTGAMVPEGADSVVMQEAAELPRPGVVRFRAPAAPGENVARRGEDVRAGQVVLERGRPVDAAAVALAAAAGCDRLEVVRRPAVSVLSTGSELVPAGSRARPPQTNDANGPALLARLRAAGFDASFLGIARDDPQELRAALERGLQSDCLVVTGGVSVGELDLVPGVLNELGVETVFSGVAIKPGKPTRFGARGRTAVWGLPGNPVSALVVTELLVLPVLRKMAGVMSFRPRPLRGILAGGVRKKPGRRLFAPARAAQGASHLDVEPLESHGAADLAAYARANALLTLREDSAGAAAGDEVELYALEAFGPMGGG